MLCLATCRDAKGKILAMPMAHHKRECFFLTHVCTSGAALGANRAFAPVTAPSVLARQQVRFRHLLHLFTICWLNLACLSLLGQVMVVNVLDACFSLQHFGRAQCSLHSASTLKGRQS